MILDRKEKDLAQKRKRLKAFFDSFVPFCDNSEYYTQIMNKIMRSKNPEKYIYIEDMDFSDSVELKINKALKGFRLDASYNTKVEPKIEQKNENLNNENLNLNSKKNIFEQQSLNLNNENLKTKPKIFNSKDEKLIKTCEFKYNFIFENKFLAHELLKKYLKEYIVEYKGKEPNISLKECVNKIFESFLKEEEYLFIYSFMDCADNEKLILINNNIMDNIINCLYKGEKEKRKLFKTVLEQNFETPFKFLVKKGDLKNHYIVFNNLNEVLNFFDYNKIFTEKMFVFSYLVNKNFVEKLFSYIDITVNCWEKFE